MRENKHRRDRPPGHKGIVQGSRPYGLELPVKNFSFRQTGGNWLVWMDMPPW
jgi:hypothetical protein